MQMNSCCLCDSKCNKISDNEISDNEISDNEISDNEISDNEISDNEISDNEISDNDSGYDPYKIYEYDYLGYDLDSFQRNLDSYKLEKYTDGIIYWSSLIEKVINLDTIYLCNNCIIETRNHQELCNGMCEDTDRKHTGACSKPMKNCLYCTL
jgi:hypothetical protein